MSKKTPQILAPDFQMPDSYDELVQVYRKAAKAADERLVRLEQLIKEENFKGVEKYAYAKAQRAIREWSGDQATRFNRKPPKSSAALKEKIQDIKTFLASTSSTKIGLKNVHMKRAQALNERYGGDWTWKQWDTFLNSEFVKKLDSKFGYGDTKDAVFAAVAQNKEEITEKLKEANEIEIYTEDDEMQSEVISNILNQYSDDVREALGVKSTKKRSTNVKSRKGKKRYRSKG